MPVLRCSEPWLHACLNLLHFRLRELDPEGLATIATSLVKLSVIISNGESGPGFQAGSKQSHSLNDNER